MDMAQRRVRAEGPTPSNSGEHKKYSTKTFWIGIQSEVEASVQPQRLFGTLGNLNASRNHNPFCVENIYFTFAQIFLVVIWCQRSILLWLIASTNSQLDLIFKFHSFDFHRRTLRDEKIENAVAALNRSDMVIKLVSPRVLAKWIARNRCRTDDRITDDEVRAYAKRVHETVGYASIVQSRGIFVWRAEKSTEMGSSSFEYFLYLFDRTCQELFLSATYSSA